MKKVIFLCLFLLGGSLLFLMTTLSGCTKPQLFFLKSIVVVPTVHKMDTSAAPINLDTIRFEELYFNLQFKMTLVAQKYNFGNSLYAFKVKEPDYINVDKIKEIRLITLFPYNQFAAGTDASALLSGAAGVMDILNQKMEAYTFNYAQFNTGFALNTPPNQASQQQFVVELVSENNTILRDTTFAFYLIP